MDENDAPRMKSGARERRIYFAIILVLFAGIFAYRVFLFSDIEPRSDQAFFSWWVQGLAQADHALPTVGPGESYLVALERDDESFLHRLLRPIYGKSITIFTSVPLALRLTAAWVFGDGYGVQVVSSILAGSLIILAVGLFPVWTFRFHLRERGRGQTNRDMNSTALLAAIFTAGASYLHYFSPWGNHNFGVLFLIIAAGATERAIHSFESEQEGSRKVILLAALLQFTALYAHWTNVFLVPAATYIALVFSAVPARRKIAIGGFYLAALLIAALPFFSFAINDLSRPDNPLGTTVWTLIGIAFDHGLIEFVRGMGARAFQWFENISAVFSVPGVILGLIGVTLLALRRRIFFPLALSIAHFLISITMALFIGAHFRTDLYVIPFLALGIAYIVALGFFAIRDFSRNWKGLARAALGALIIALATQHLWRQVNRTGPAGLIERENPEFWAAYFQGQGEIGPMAGEIDKILPERAVILTWGYGMQFFLRNYGIERSGRKIEPTLLTLLPRFNNGALAGLIKRRGLSIAAGVPIFSLVDLGADQTDRETVRRGIENILGPAGFDLAAKVTLEPRGRWRLSSSWPRDVALYRVVLE
ncbi:MAG TPA: hypothetical protein ENI69_02865 [Rhodospirillales bacterium]|nr:hypothetical protein [Rhodospirillales bacterium]